MFRHTLLAASVGLVCFSALATETTNPSQEELWQAIKTQQKTIDQLTAKIKETEAKTEATAEALESQPSASKTFIGGYGELHYNQWDNNAVPSGLKDKEEMDFHRFVLLIGHEFSDSVRFFSEFELEHGVAGESKKGEVELEQAYLQWQFADKHNLKAGVFLVPVGIINETHEPDTFYGVERNSVENKIIPTTWWEGGAALSGELSAGWSYDLALHSGLYVPTGKFQVRDGRQKVSEAKAESNAYTSRIKYTAIPGLEIALSMQHQEDFSQGLSASSIPANLIEAHAVYQKGMFGLRALYASWSIDSSINSVAAGADEQSGYYLEPSLKLNDKWGVFTRYSQWDNQAGDSSNSEFDEVSLGVNYWLTETTVLKADTFKQSAPTGKDEFEGFNLGVGYSF